MKEDVVERRRCPDKTSLDSLGKSVSATLHVQ